MRRLLPAIAVCALFALAPIADASIVGSSHDFSGEGWSNGKLCEACHTPHDASNALSQVPLWNHATTSATFGVYTSPTMDETAQQPRQRSKVCLSCHDGTIAIDSYGGQSGTAFIGGVYDLGTALGNDHPVSVKWTHQTVVPMCNNCHGKNPSQIVSKLIFPDGYVECVSCHDVHNRNPANPKFLRETPNGSLICLKCHRK